MCSVIWVAVPSAGIIHYTLIKDTLKLQTIASNVLFVKYLKKT